MSLELEASSLFQDSLEIHGQGSDGGKFVTQWWTKIVFSEIIEFYFLSRYTFRIQHWLLRRTKFPIQSYQDKATRNLEFSGADKKFLLKFVQQDQNLNHLLSWVAKSRGGEWKLTSLIIEAFTKPEMTWIFNLRNMSRHNLDIESCRCESFIKSCILKMTK